MALALMFRFSKFSTWSFIKAIKGEITKHKPGLTMAGT